MEKLAEQDGIKPDLTFKNRKGEFIDNNDDNILNDDIFDEYDKLDNKYDNDKIENNNNNDENGEEEDNEQQLDNDEKIDFVSENVSENFKEQHNMYGKPKEANNNNSHGK